MAVANLSKFTSSDYFGSPLSIKRGNPNPLDASEIFGTLGELETYAASDPTAYVGQVCTVVEKVSIDAIDVPTEVIEVSAYQIIDEAGTLKKFGETVTDNAEFNTIKEAVEKLLADEFTEGSVKYVEDNAKVFFEKETETTQNIYSFYQGFDVTEEPVLDEDGAPTFDSEGNPITTKKKTKKLLGKIEIEKDMFVETAKVVEVALNDSEELEDSDGVAVPDTVTEAGMYIKMVMSNEDIIYVPVSSLSEGVIRSIKIGDFEFGPNKSGVVDVFAVPVSSLFVDVDNLILNGGDAGLTDKAAKIEVEDESGMTINALELEKGSSYTIVVKDADGTPITEGLKFVSSNPAILVSDEGVVTIDPLAFGPISGVITVVKE